MSFCNTPKIAIQPNEKSHIRLYIVLLVKPYVTLKYTAAQHSVFLWKQNCRNVCMQQPRTFYMLSLVKSNNDTTPQHETNASVLYPDRNKKDFPLSAESDHPYGSRTRTKLLHCDLLQHKTTGLKVSLFWQNVQIIYFVSSAKLSSLITNVIFNKAQSKSHSTPLHHA